MGAWAEGIYEALRTVALDRELDSPDGVVPVLQPVDREAAADVLARHIAALVRRAVEAEPDTERRVALVNQITEHLNADDDALPGTIEQLLALSSAEPVAGRTWPRPVTPLSDAALLTNSPGEPALSTELRAELASADRVDLLCAFIRWHGLRVLEEPLQELRERGAPFRVITTTYVGATERRAVDELVNRFGAQVKINYETQSTRLHAKAWLLRRNSGFDTAYVGSSNLSRSALVDGLEWNVRLSGVATPDLLRKFEATFDTYWESNACLPYNPGTDAELFDDAISRARNRGAGTSSITVSGLDVRAMPHQVEILEALESERALHGQHRNLVVAATGTGKTVVAALDYRRIAEATDGASPTLLFVAHRSEILDQSLRTYREVMRDGTFGETYVGGQRPERWRHVFASVQSLSSLDVTTISPDHFDVVVVDEFHHAEAASYRRILDHLQPKELLGLTATPERGDGVDVRAFFNNRSAYELPLWDAVAADLLVPFHYFGVNDDVDLTRIEWRRNRYDDAALSRLYTGNDARARRVLATVRDKVADPQQMRALGFCVSVAHAEYMAHVFCQSGLPAIAVSGSTRTHDRAEAIEKLRRGDVTTLFAADLFNEGLDIPEVDTVLFLRPTQSATIFLQQFGRGLRRAPGKAVLTVLDFIGQHRKEYRFDMRYRALTGATRRALSRQIEQGFPFLPSGSQIVLDRVARQTVLENVRSQLRTLRRDLVGEVRSYGVASLATYLYEAEREVVDVYRSNGSWTSLRREAGQDMPAAGPGEGKLLRRMAALAHVDDPERASAYARLVEADGQSYGAISARDQRFARMLFFSLWPDGGGFGSYDDGLAALRRHPAVCDEIRQIVALGADRTRYLPEALDSELGHVPMSSHAHYRREEILAALGYANLRRPPRHHQSGVVWVESENVDAFLVSLTKSEKEFLPTTMYRDYAISPELFHWESQNSTSLASPTGRRYLSGSSHVLLFVRNTTSDDLGAAPYLCLGEASYVSHQGERPIAMTWRLRRAMPAETFSVASVAA
ncbi:DUF3427 domain-containing protein [Phytoactinopolyspora limicola]|uniref:DUF3427 domain-containing protein n=1 Tax=Phytoactinopolyspora limicola TaxID=2715536 RepID=UPI00140D2645|nr:DEAD/DEAH box helicase [Phytoactinopolyspora limicola]